MLRFASYYAAATKSIPRPGHESRNFTVTIQREPRCSWRVGFAGLSRSNTN